MYEVSSLGRVMSLERVVPVRNHFRYERKRIGGRVLKGWVGNNGYRMVTLVGEVNKTVLVHRLVCEAFHGPCPKGHEVCHGPNGKLDNRAESLCWGTRSKNHGEDRDRDGSKIQGEAHHMSRLTTKDVLDIRKRAGERSPNVAKDYNVAPRTIRDIWNGLTWKHVID